MNWPTFWNLYSAPVLLWIVYGNDNNGKTELTYSYVVYPHGHSALDDEL